MNGLHESHFWNSYDAWQVIDAQILVCLNYMTIQFLHYLNDTKACQPVNLKSHSEELIESKHTQKEKYFPASHNIGHFD